eukprot:TRINITY_DN798_c0_g2_i1.p1 TRINITY_DN798_c0_g2~~TRINITY_DN798_c0_g2_i1.p1  ORF type:complete len:760 (+),score=331.53 TRINITY_DN798_c0_g2_i1:50-2329(+)
MAAIQFKNFFNSFLIFYFFLFLIISNVLTNPITNKKKAQDICSGLSLMEKIGQMSQLDISIILKPGTYQIDKELVKAFAQNYFIGSYLNSPSSGGGRAPTAQEWIEIITDIQSTSLEYGNQIPIIYGLDTVHGANYVNGAALFPQQIGTAATFNLSHAEAVGEIGGKDTKAVGISWVFSPILDIATMPLWARVYETFGEDPFLAAEMGKAIIKGYQGNNLTYYEESKVAACMKHFIGYCATRSGHDKVPAWIPDRLLSQYYVPPYISAIEAGVATAMESYADVNGVPVVASTQYLKTLLRDQLNFTGMLVTDYAEIEELHNFHYAAASIKEAVQITMSRTTIDMSMIPLDVSFPTFLYELVKEGSIPESRVDESCARVVELKVALGLFDNPIPDPNNNLIPTIGSSQDRSRALDACRESITLLKNDNNLLPLSLSKSTKLLVTGPSANSIGLISGGWTINWQGTSDDSLFSYGSTILKAIQTITQGSSVTVQYSKGCNIDGSNTNEQLNDAINLAQQSDVLIVAIGEDHYAEIMGDISDLTLVQGQRDFVNALINTGKPIVLVLVEGRPRILAGIEDKVSSVVHTYLPGPEGGQALAEILFGIVNPSGRLPMNYPKNTGDIPFTYWHKVTETGTVAWEFGTGLSYSKISVSNLQLSNQKMYENETISVSVSVTNSGPYTAKYSVLMYIRDQYRSITPEVKMLKAFEKIELQVGQSRVVNFEINSEMLSFYGIDNTKQVEAGMFYVYIDSLQQSFELLTN